MKRFSVLLLVALALTTAGCKKAEIHGCTDYNALNYSNVAQKDDGSCILPSDIESEVPNTDAKVFSTTLYFYAGDTYKNYSGIIPYFSSGDIILTFIEDPNESNLNGFWVQTPFLSDDNVNFYTEITDIGNVFVNTTYPNGTSPWTGLHYFNYRFVLIKASGLAQNPDLDLTNYEEIKAVFNL